MYRLTLSLAFLALATLCLVGCTSSTTPVPADSTNVESDKGSTTRAATDPTAATDVESDDTTNDFTSIQDPLQLETDDPAGEKTADEYMQEIQRLFNASMVNNRPSPAGMDAAIAKANEALVTHTDDENLVRIKSVLLFQSLQVEPEEQKLNERRLELGQLARTLLERNKDNPEDLGNMPSILMFEEAKAYIAKEDLAQAWNSLKEAHDNGFDQAQVLYLDPTFEPLVQNEQYGAELEGWISDSIDDQMAAFESFPLVFSLRQLNGEDDSEVSLADFEGKPVIVDFWGTWCPPCRAALPHLIDLHNEHKDELAVVGINFEERLGASNFEETKEIFDKFAEKEPLPYPCLYGTSGLTAQVPNFRGFPTMVFLDKTGRVRLALTGYNPAPVLEAVVNKLLAE